MEKFFPLLWNIFCAFKAEVWNGDLSASSFSVTWRLSARDAWRGADPLRTFDYLLLLLQISPLRHGCCQFTSDPLRLTGVEWPLREAHTHEHSQAEDEEWGWTPSKCTQSRDGKGDNSQRKTAFNQQWTLPWVFFPPAALKPYVTYLRL